MRAWSCYVRYQQWGYYLTQKKFNTQKTLLQKSPTDNVDFCYQHSSSATHFQYRVACSTHLAPYSDLELSAQTHIVCCGVCFVLSLLILTIYYVEIYSEDDVLC